MDKLAISGFLLAILAVAGGFVIEGGSLATLIHFPAFLIVFGGTLGAVMLQTPLNQFMLGLKMLPWVFRPAALPLQHTAERIVHWGSAARGSGFLALENDALAEHDAFLHRGLNLLVDGVEPAVLQDTLDAELTLERERELKRTGQVTASANPVPNEFGGADYFLTGKLDGMTTRTDEPVTVLVAEDEALIRALLDEALTIAPVAAAAILLPILIVQDVAVVLAMMTMSALRGAGEDAVLADARKPLTDDRARDALFGKDQYKKR